MSQQAVARVDEARAANPTEVTAFVQMIERAAANPAVDVDKMERLLAMQERVLERNARAAFTAALAELQPKLPVIDQNGQIRHGENKPVQSTYAKYEDINDAIRPLLHQHGFALSFRITRTDALVSITGVLSHRDGHSGETTIDLPADGSGSKNAVQAVGSSITYGKRYAAIALLNITSRAPQDRDDDGNAAGGLQTILPAQVDELRDLIESVGADRQKFLDFWKIEGLSDLKAKDFPRAVAMLEAKRAK